MPVSEVMREHQHNSTGSSSSATGPTRNRLLAAVAVNRDSSQPSPIRSTSNNQARSNQSAVGSSSILNEALRSVDDGPSAAAAASSTHSAEASTSRLPIQVTDAQILTQSVLQQRERERITLSWIERLADSRDQGKEISREHLKRAVSLCFRLDHRIQVENSDTDILRKIELELERRKSVQNIS